MGLVLTTHINGNESEFYQVQANWLRREEAIMKHHDLPADHGDDARAETPLEIMAGVLPFILFGLKFTLEGVDYPRQSSWVVLMTSIWLAGVVTRGYRLFGYTFGREQWGWRGWLPLLALAAVMLLFTRSYQPLRRLFQDVRRDWTRLSFALYAAVAWLLMVSTYDGKTWYNQTFYLALNLFLLTLVFAGGAFLYMRDQRPWPRTLALPAALILYLLVALLVTALDGHSEFGSPSTAFGWLSYLLLLLMWVSVPLWPAAARHVWRRFRPL